jgi:peptidoglycan/LPS O-acetylase OafA/YrhL
VGTLSYSIYLWQQIFLHHGDPSALDTPAPLNLAIAAAAAMVSFYVIEQPFLRWRERLEPRLFPKKA